MSSSSRAYKNEPLDDSSDDDLIEISVSKTPHPNKTIKKDFKAPENRQHTSPSAFHSHSSPIKKRRSSLESSTWIDKNNDFKHSQHEHSPSRTSPDKSFLLSKEQQLVIRLALKGRSLFYTGAAGTGKSLLLRCLIDRLRKRHNTVAVTSSTGIAAVNVGGITLHSFAGVGLAKEDAKTLVKKVRKNESACDRWRETSVLVIDEVSMVDGLFFTKLEYIARCIRCNNFPFGGIQVICTGDFFQLPPVPDKYIPDDGHSFVSTPRVYCFETEAWHKTITQCIVLQQVFRQKGDNEFIEILNAMRLGRLTDKMNEKLRSLDRPVVYKDGITPTMLYATRNKVQQYNSTKLAELPGKRYFYTSTDIIPENVPSAKVTQALKRLDEIVSSEIELRQDCQIMIVRNIIDSGLANGTLGRVLGFLTQRGYTHVQGIASREQISTSSPEFQQLVRDHQAKEEEKYNNGKTKIYISCHKVVDDDTPLPIISLTTDTMGSSRLVHQLNPIDNFVTIGGKPEHIESTSSNEFKIPLFSKNGSEIEELKQPPEVKRIQIPLIYSWAMSIHKAQGQTLPRVRIDLANIFESGHAYVAISRATSTKTLEVLNYNPAKVTVDPKVAAFYRNLEKAAIKLSPDEQEYSNQKQDAVPQLKNEQESPLTRKRKIFNPTKGNELHNESTKKQREEVKHEQDIKPKHEYEPVSQNQVIDIDSDSSIEILD